MLYFTYSLFKHTMHFDKFYFYELYLFPKHEKTTQYKKSNCVNNQAWFIIYIW